jgi:hypothetical protein
MSLLDSLVGAQFRNEKAGRVIVLPGIAVVEAML